MQPTLVQSLIAGDRTRHAPGPHLTPEFLTEAAVFAARYARLEKLLFGGTKVAYSNSALAMNLSLAGDMMRQGEALADAERTRFGLDVGPILELGWLIEDQGVKIIPRRFPATTPAHGGFFFDSVTGPCILLDATATPTQRDYVLAHQYGHFLADYDPYIAAICGHPGPETVLDPRELRAHAFALAFLMPRRDLDTYRSAFGLAPDAPVSADFVRQLQVYFAVDYEMVFWRLLAVAWIEPAAVQSLLEANPEFLEPVEVDRMDADERLAFLGAIPERYVHLVASGFGRGLLELEDAAEYLGTDEAETRHVLEQFHYEDSSGSAKAPAKSKGVPPPAAPGVGGQSPPPHPN